MRSKLLLTACMLAVPGTVHAQDTTVAAGETRTSSLNMDAADTLTVVAGGTFRVSGNQTVNINGGSTGTGLVITNDGTIEAVPTSATNGRAITGSTPATDRTATIINRGDILGANDAIRFADSSSSPSAGGTITIDNAGRIISSGLNSGGTVTQLEQGIEVGIMAATVNITNRSGGLIQGGHGIQSSSGNLTIVNSGRIIATGTPASQGEGIRTSTVGSAPSFNPVLNLTNEAGGVISGGYGVTGVGTTTIVNRGTIQGDSDNPVSHARTGIRVITSFAGQNNSVSLLAGSRTAAGTGAGGTGQAVNFSGSQSGTNTLTIETGAIIEGSLRAATSANINDILVLTGSGTQVLDSTQDFDTLRVEGGTWGITNSITARNGATIDAGATLRYDDTADASGGGLVRGGTILNNGTIVINRTSSVSQSYDADGVGGADPIHATISGTGGVRLTGNSTFSLTAANSYSGDTVIQSGRLRTDADNVLSPFSSITVSGTGVLDLNDDTSDAGGAATPIAHSQTIANLSGDGSVRTGSLNGATLTTGSAGGNTVFSGVISQLGGLTKVGSGTLTLSGVNTATGQLRVSAGGVSLPGRWSGDVLLENGTSLSGAGTISGALNVGDATIAPGNSGIGTLTTGALTLTGGSVLAFDLGAPGTGDRIQVNGNLVLDGTLNVNDVGGFGEGVYRLFNYTGGLTDNGLLVGTVPGGAIPGLMQIQTSVATQVNLVYGTPIPTTIQFWDGGDIAGNGTVDGGSGSWTNGQPNWTDAAGANNTAWSNAFGVFQGTAGTVTVDDAIQFTGAQFMTDGYVIAQGTGTLSAAQSLTNIRVDPGVTATIAANIGGTGGLLKNDAGTLILSGTNSYAGLTNINGGTVRLTSASAIPVTSQVSVGAAGTLDVEADQEIGNLAGAGAVILDANLATGGLGGDTSFTGILSGNGGLTKKGSGTLTLGGANAYLGSTNVNAGAIVLASGGRIGSGDLAIAGGASADLGGQANAVGQLSGAGALRLGTGGSLTTDSASSSAFAGALDGQGATLVKAGAGTLTLSGTSNSLGTLQVNGGRLVSAANGSIGSNANVTVGGGEFEIGASQSVATLNGGGNVFLGGNRLTVAGDANSNYTGVASGAGGLTKTGAGTLTLAGANGYAGATDVSGGTLALEGSVAGAVNVASGATLSGSGTAGGIVTIADGGRLSVGGAAAGTLTTGGLVLSQNSVLDYGLGAPGVAGASDRIQVNGNLTLDGRLNVTDLGGFGVGVYRLVDYTGALTDNGLELGTFPAGTTLSRVQVQTAVGQQVNLVVEQGLPEVQFWDGANTASNGVIEGGSGSWTNGPRNWTGANGTGNSEWGGRFAVFQGAAGTVTVNDTIAFSGMQFMTDGYVIAGGTGSLNAVEPLTNLRVDPGVTGTISASIGGTGGLNKLDTGTLILSGSNSYAGETIVAGGTLRAGATGALPGGTAVTVASGATLDLAASQTIGSLAGAGSVTLTGGSLTTGGANSSTRFDGVISGSGSLTKTGTGVFTLAGANSYTGGTTVAAGTLRLAGGGLGSGDLAVASGATFDMNGVSTSVASLSGAGSILLGAGTLSAGGSANSSFGGVISGSGGLTKTGTGNLTLAGANTYTGLTTVRTGTLTLNTGAVPTAAAVAIENGGTLALGGAVQLGALSGTGNVALGANTLSLAAGNYAGAIGGTGGLTKTGSGTLTLTGTNGYTGATNVNGGVLAIGQNGSIAASSGVTLASGGRFDISAGGAQSVNGLVGVSGTTVVLGANRLTVNNAGANAFAGVMSGTGGLTKAGAGTLTLSGANSYTGGTIVNGGVLAAGIANAFGPGPLAVNAPGSVTLGTFNQTLENLSGNGAVNLGSATLTVNGSSSSTYAGVLSGTGRLTRTGTGTLTLSGDNTYTGPTTVTSGQLVVDGSLASVVTVAAQGRLGGSGRVAGLTVNGTVAPGNSIGTLNVAGALTFASGSIYQVEIAPNGTSDRIIASGAVTINGGTVQVLSANAPGFANATNYTILTGASVAGTFTGLTSDLAFYTPSLVYGAADVQLRILRNDVQLVDVAATPNQIAVATVLDAKARGDVYDGLLNLDAASARNAYDLLSGEAHVAAAALAARDAHAGPRALLDRLNTSSGEGMQIWIEGNLGKTKAKARDGLARVEADRTTLAGGIEYSDEDTRGGLALRHSTGDVDLAARASSGELKTDAVFAYLRQDVGNIRVAGGAGFAAHSSNIDREVAFGNFANSLTSKEKGSSLISFVEVSYRSDLGGLDLEPYAGASLARTKFDGIREAGGVSGLAVGKLSERTALANYGVRVSKPFGGLLLTADIGGRSYLGGGIDSRRFAFNAGSGSFETEGAPFGKHSIAGRLDATYVTGGTMFGIGVRGETAKEGSTYGVRATIGHRF